MSTRFSSLDWANPIVGIDIKILGLGGVGSWEAFYLNRIGIHNIVAIDNGSFESVNIANSLAGNWAVNYSKATSADRMYRDFVPKSKHSGFVAINGDCRENYPRSYQSTIVISCLDSISTRAEEFRYFKSYVDWDKPSAFIDIRMAAEVGTIYIVNSPEDISRYEETLFDQSEAYVMPCGNKATSHCSSALSCWATAMVNNIIVNHFEGFTLRRVPFKYHIDMINFKNEAYD